MRIASLKKALSMFQDIYPDMPLPMMLTFLEIASNDGYTISQVKDRVGISAAAASRHCNGLADTGVGSKPGYRLVEFRFSKEDARTKQLHLTEKGKSLLNKIRYLK